MPAKETIQQGTIKIYAGAEEKIGLPNYSNVVVSASVSRNIPETDDAEAIKQELRDNFLIVEQVLYEERNNVLETLKQDAETQKARTPSGS